VGTIVSLVICGLSMRIQFHCLARQTVFNVVTTTDLHLFPLFSDTIGTAT